MALKILKSAAIAIVCALVCASAYPLIWMTMLSAHHFHGAVGAVSIDGVSLFRYNVRLWVVVVGVFALVAGYCFHMMNRGRSIPLPLLTATLGFCVAWAASALFLFAVWASSPPAGGDSVWMLAIGMWSLSIATFAFFAGLAGGAWLAQRRTKIRSISRLMWESAAVGAALGALFGLLVVANSTPPPGSREVVLFGFLSAVPGGICAVFVTLALRRRFVSAG